ncbi:MAG: pilus assembly protein PilM [Candidatus Omnitrophica bacterium]|nr:pilus assembly protein PilM [Candidatus Omnitrophota bacterium]
MSVCLALDIGSHYIKVVEGYSKKDRLVVRKAGITRNPFPNAHISLNENLQKQFATFLKDFLKKLGVKRSETVCGISGEGLIIHYFDIPDVPENEIKNIVEMELLQVIPGGAEKIEFDYAILPAQNSGKKTVMVAGIPRSKSSFFVNTLIMAGLKPIIMDISGVSLANCFMTFKKNNQKSAAVINVGARYTNIAIIEKKGFVFVREIEFGGNLINREITRLKNISNLEAENFKKNPQFSDEIEKILKEISAEFIQEISVSLKYFETRTSEKAEKFFLTGGSSLLPGFLGIIEKTLEIPGEIWTPMSGLYESCKTDESECVEPCFSQVLGLALRKIV